MSETAREGQQQEPQLQHGLTLSHFPLVKPNGITLLLLALHHFSFRDRVNWGRT